MTCWVVKLPSTCLGAIMDKVRIIQVCSQEVCDRLDTLVQRHAAPVPERWASLLPDVVLVL